MKVVFLFFFFHLCFLKKLIQTVLVDCVLPSVNFKNNLATYVNLFNFSHLAGNRTARSDFDWLSDLRGREKQTYHALGLENAKAFKSFFLKTIFM